MKNSQKIQSAILDTVNFFDLFDFPLTKAEIIDNLWKCEAKSVDIIDQIDILIRENILSTGESFIFLSGRQDLIKIRKERYLSSFYKLQQIEKEKWMFALSPFVKMIAIANTLAYSNAKADGDIDILVVTQKNRLYTTRIFLTFWLLLLGKWRHGNNVKDRYCLSFLVTEDNIDMSNLKFPDSDDIYLCFWTKWLKPWFVTDNTVAKRYFTENIWVKKYIPNTMFFNTNNKVDGKYFIAKFFELLLHGGLGDLLENILSRMMQYKIKRNTINFDIDGTIADHKTLKFHPSGKRTEYEKRWLEKMTKKSL